MAFNWFDLIVLFGILQGLVCAVLLTRKKPVDISQKLLIAVLLVFCLLSFKIELHTLGLWDTLTFRYFPLGIDLLIQPLLYFYVASLTQPGFKLKGSKWLHLIPPFFFLVHSLLMYFILLPVGTISLKDAIADQLYYNAIKNFEDILSVVSAFIYGYLCLRSVNHYQKWLHQTVSDSSYATLDWLKRFLLLTGILGFILFINISLDNSSTPNHFFRWQFFYVYLAVLIYYIGMRGLTARPLPAQEAQKLELVLTAKYMDEELSAATITIVKALEENHAFLDSELTLQKFAASIQLSPALVSTAINKNLSKSFRTLVNAYRVETVKLKLIDPQLAHLSLWGIALEAGFNSEASFYRIFRSATGHSPKGYIKAFSSTQTPATN